jgi:hypothetical protein
MIHTCVRMFDGNGSYFCTDLEDEEKLRYILNTMKSKYTAYSVHFNSVQFLFLSSQFLMQ